MIGWLDAQAGASGDMMLGALADAGVPLEIMQSAVDQLGLDITLTCTQTTRQGIGGVKVDVDYTDDAHSRTWADVQAILKTLEPSVRAPAYATFERLAHAEAAVHRTPVDEVHFHEVGAHDALADIVGSAAGLHHLGLHALHCSAVALGSGATHGHHGPIPIPAPAVLEILTGAPVTSGPADHESTTPTGAALLATHVTDWGRMPAMIPARVGHGCGARDPRGQANVLRLVLGEPAVVASHAETLLEANLDDLDPRLWPHVLERLMQAGARDAWLTPILMKKGRPAHTLSVLCAASDAATLRATIFRETTTIGLREVPVTKHALERTQIAVELEGHVIRIKCGWLDGEIVNRSAEWEDVLAAAGALKRPAKQILADALNQAAGHAKTAGYAKAAGYAKTAGYARTAGSGDGCV